MLAALKYRAPPAWKAKFPVKLVSLMLAATGGQAPFRQPSIIARPPPVPMSVVEAAVTALLENEEETRVRVPDCRLIAPPLSVARLASKKLFRMVTFVGSDTPSPATASNFHDAKFSD